MQETDNIGKVIFSKYGTLIWHLIFGLTHYFWCSQGLYAISHLSSYENSFMIVLNKIIGW